jgi:uncharacterized protein
MSIQQQFNPNNLSDDLLEKWTALLASLSSMQNIVIAFSGGVDSSLLSVAAQTAKNVRMLAVTVSSPLQLRQDKFFVDSIVKQFHFPHRLVEYNDLLNPKFTENDSLRCYYCKLDRFKIMREIAHSENFQWVVEGSNLDDLADYRPGMQAIRELNIRSPFLEIGMTKMQIRTLAHALGLPNAISSTGSCYATRIPFGTQISMTKIHLVAAGEDELLKMGFNPCRVRFRENVAHIEINPIQFPLALEFREIIIKKFKEIGFLYVLMDLEGYRTGSMNEVIKR